MNTFRCIANNKKGSQCQKPSVKTLDTGEPVCLRHFQIGARSVPQERRYIEMKVIHAQLREAAAAENARMHMIHLHNESLSLTRMHEGHELRVHLHIDHIAGTLAITPQRFMVRMNEDPRERRERNYTGYSGEMFGFINGKDPDKWLAIATLITEAAEQGRGRLAEVKAAKLRTTISDITIDEAEFKKP